MEVKEYIKTTAVECQKSQEVRLIDVFVIAPILIYGGIQYRKVLPKWLSLSLVVIGGCTLYYNAKNYMETKKLNEKSDKNG
jgi:hypothetical protein